MEKFLVAPLLLRKLQQEDTFRSYFSLFLKFLAAISAITALIVFFLGWKELFARSSEGMIGGTIYQLAFAAAAYLVVHFIILRAAEAKEPAPNRSAALSVAVVGLKLAGEAWGFASALLGTGAAVYVWFAGSEARVLLQKTAVFFPFLKAGPASFTAGTALIFQGLLYGALALLLGYLLADLLMALPANPGAEESTEEKPSHK